MADPFVGEIKINAFGFAPRGWSTCDGQVMTIQQNSALYALLGTYYGGDGKANFCLPDLRGRTPVHFGVPSYQYGTTYNIGNAAGAETVALTISTMPNHNHPCYGVGVTANKTPPTGNFYAQPSMNIYVSPPSRLTSLHPSTVSGAGTGQAHNNMQPSLTLNFCIATVGYFPPRQ